MWFEKRWKYKKAEGHHHVIISKDEVLDVDTEEHARAIAQVPQMIDLIEDIAGPLTNTSLGERANKILRKLK